MWLKCLSVADFLAAGSALGHGECSNCTGQRRFEAQKPCHTWLHAVEFPIRIARRLRISHPDLGIVMLSGRSAVAERVEGMREGADIYLIKPADSDELEASIKSIALRLAQNKENAAPAWVLNAIDMRITSPSGNTVELNYTETQLLQTFAQSPNFICTRDALVLAIGKNPATYDPRSLKVIISRLRSKLGEAFLIKYTTPKGYAFAGEINLFVGR
jgi:DNA-binding response OmpR family regulator